MDRYIWTYTIDGTKLESREFCIVKDTVLGNDTTVWRILDLMEHILMPGCYKDMHEIAEEMASWGGMITPLTTPENDLLWRYIQTYGELEEEDEDER